MSFMSMFSLLSGLNLHVRAAKHFLDSFAASWTLLVTKQMQYCEFVMVPLRAAGTANMVEFVTVCAD
jgi:hypothetical protein